MVGRFRAAVVQALLVGAVVLTAGCSCPVSGPASHYDLDGDCVALDGYDPVAYHTEERALEGEPEITFEHEGAVYQFASASNREAFSEEPERYVAAYGGWCAYAVYGGGTFFADPESFVLKDGRLFLFHDSIFFDGKQAWEERDHEQRTASADAYWAQMSE